MVPGVVRQDPTKTRWSNGSPRIQLHRRRGAMTQRRQESNWSRSWGRRRWRLGSTSALYSLAERVSHGARRFAWEERRLRTEPGSPPFKCAVLKQSRYRRVTAFLACAPVTSRRGGRHALRADKNTAIASLTEALEQDAVVASIDA